MSIPALLRNKGSRPTILVLVGLASAVFQMAAYGNHMTPPNSVALVGDLQSELGCPGDWQPECVATELVLTGDAWQITALVPAGNWQYKVALNDTWDENYGAGGVGGGDNIPLFLPEALEVTFTYNPHTHQVSNDAPVIIPQPTSVTVAGSFQEELGCPGDWQPACTLTQLSFDSTDGVWQGVFTVPSSEGGPDWEYKAALNGSWDENYGQNANAGGSNIALSTAESTEVKFFYDHATHWITDNQRSVIATAPGSYQSELGCPGDWQPDCLRSWLQDPDGDGVYSFVTTALPAGDYQVKVAHNESWSENYGQGGVRNGANIDFSVPEDNDLVVFNYSPDTHELSLSGSVPVGNLREAKAYWLAEDTLAWDVPAESEVRLHYSAEADLAVSVEGLSGGLSIGLEREGVVDGEIAEKFRHLTGLPVYKIAPADVEKVPTILKQQLALSAVDAEGEAIDATGIQPAGVLDDLFTYHGNLGVSFSPSFTREDDDDDDDDEQDPNPASPSLRVWAPTARSVKLHLFDRPDQDEAAQVVDMVEDPRNGTWSIEGSTDWNRKYYLYEVEVYARSTGNIEKNLVTDPYSLSLAMNSVRSQIVNLNDPDLKPEDWDEDGDEKPELEAPEDVVVYELHVRDFSIHDATVPEKLRGTFKAFTQEQSRGMKHLRALARSGLTHIHLLPAFDCATIPEDPAQRKEVGDLSSFASNSEKQQEAAEAIRGQDGFNWCYDPYHYTVPEGSYSTHASGVTRIKEFREMVSALSDAGLRVVMDVVYNHTSGSLQGDKSVLDKIVPDYYHRLNSAGAIEMSTCCANTATEHNMMEKLMLDSLRTWAVDYHVDGFRFDLMGHHTKANLLKARDSLQALTLAKDGVDGRAIYLYGEGWNFGEVVNDARFEQATQYNMGQNTGIGSFNDRMRDAVRGGGPFDTGIGHVVHQGFINGLYYDPNGENSGSPAELSNLQRVTDWVRIGLVGSLSEYPLVNQEGNLVLGKDLDYGGKGGVGYTSDPQEAINYIAAHDNETLFDINQYKLPLSTSAADRMRVQNIGNSLVALAQGVPFFHAGQDMMRSKSLDRNSYDSGDWFNLLDFSYRDNGWARGLPPRGDNESNWSVARPLLADPSLSIGKDEIVGAARHLREMMEIRKSSSLFRLQTAEEIIKQVTFHNTGPNQVPGLVVMSLSNSEGEVEYVVLFNASTEEQDFVIQSMADNEFELHPVQRRSFDPLVKASSYREETGRFRVPARTTAVFENGD